MSGMLDVVEAKYSADVAFDLLTSELQKVSAPALAAASLRWPQGSELAVAARTKASGIFSNILVH